MSNLIEWLCHGPGSTLLIGRTVERRLRGEASYRVPAAELFAFEIVGEEFADETEDQVEVMPGDGRFGVIPAGRQREAGCAQCRVTGSRSRRFHEGTHEVDLPLLLVRGNGVVREFAHRRFGGYASRNGCGGFKRTIGGDTGFETSVEPAGAGENSAQAECPMGAARIGSKRPAKREWAGSFYAQRL